LLSIGKLNHNKPTIYFVGLSAKPNCDHLSTQTNTGSVIEQIIHHIPDMTSIKTNLVKDPPLDRRGNLRYPNFMEMERGWNDLLYDMTDISPNLIVTLGLQVSFFIRTKMGIQPAKPILPPDFSSQTYLSQSASYLLSVHHPSFVVVYRRSYIENYVNSVVQSILSIVLT